MISFGWIWGDLWYAGYCVRDVFIFLFIFVVIIVSRGKEKEVINFGFRLYTGFIGSLVIFVVVLDCDYGFCR